MNSLVGQTLRDSYILEELLGEGNFGAVFRGTQLFLGTPVRSVAVKLTKDTNLDISTARMIFADAFLQAQALQKMTDARARQHLVHVYDMGIALEEKRGFIVMEHIQGTTLADRLASPHPIPTTQLVDWMSQICHVLHKLHTLVPPLLHRDLKPDNILLGSDGILRIVDFGLAASLMQHGFARGFVGTLAYMAPETMIGESVPASDVYSIGVIFYQSLTGSHPFAHLLPLMSPTNFNREQFYQQMNTYRPPPPSHLNSIVPAALDALVSRCLEFYPNKRYYNAGALLRELTRIQEMQNSRKGS